jgi:hypothetical protein
VRKFWPDIETPVPPSADPPEGLTTIFVGAVFVMTIAPLNTLDAPERETEMFLGPATAVAEIEMLT